MNQHPTNTINLLLYIWYGIGIGGLALTLYIIMKTKNKIQNSKIEQFVAEFKEKHKTREDIMKLEFELGID